MTDDDPNTPTTPEPPADDAGADAPGVVQRVGAALDGALRLLEHQIRRFRQLLDKLDSTTRAAAAPAPTPTRPDLGDPEGADTAADTSPAVTYGSAEACAKACAALEQRLAEVSDKGSDEARALQARIERLKWALATDTDVKAAATEEGS